MNRRNTLSSLSAAAIAWLPFLVAPAAGDPILEIYSDSLTSYLADPSAVQGVHPLVDQRGVNIDGALRLGGGPPMSLAGNPFGEAWDGNTLLSGIRLDTGTVSITDVDLALPSPGFSWVIGRSFNVRQLNTEGDGYTDSNGYQGYNWFQLSQPEIVFYDHDGNPNTTEATDMVYLVYGADRFIEFKRANASSDQFKAVNGAAGVMDFKEDYTGTDTPDVYVYTDQRGWQHFFYGFDDDIAETTALGQFWKTVAPSITNAAEAFYGQTSAPGMLSASDPAGRGYEYTYTNGRLTQVQVTTSGLVARVKYEYYSGTGDPNGLDGDLKLVTITTPLTNANTSPTVIDNEWLIRKKYYRYYTSSYNASANPPNLGNPHHLKMIVDFEGTRRYSWDLDQDLTTDDFPSADDEDLMPYASAYFEYEDSDFANGKHRRITKAWFNGSCGCSGAINGVHEFSYACNGTCLSYGNPGYDTGWKTRTVVKRPDTVYQTGSTVQSWLTQYFDETGQPLGLVLTNADPAQSPTMVLATQVVRDTAGCITAIHSPANVTGYSHGGATPGTFTTDDNNGLITIFTRLTTSDDADLVGFLRHVKWKQGSNTSNPENLSRSIFYVPSDDDNRAELTIGGTVTIVRPMVNALTEYASVTTTPDSPGSPPASGVNRTTIAYGLYIDEGEPLAVETATTSFPAVSTSKNGSGSATSSAAYFDKAGRMVFEKTTDGTINYWQYRASDGQLEKMIEDANTSNTNNFGGSCAQVPSGFASCQTNCTPFDILHCYTYLGGGSGSPSSLCACSIGTPAGNSVTDGSGPTAVSYTARLKDGRIVTLGFAHWVDASSDEYYGPVSYTVTNHAGRVELEGVVALSGGAYTTASSDNFVDESVASPLTAFAGIGTLAQMTVSLYNETGQRLEESRQYFAIPTIWPDTTTDKYDSTLYGYDAAGRSARIVDPTGTIRRSVYDSAGRLTEQWLGTDDSAGWEGTSGTSNLVKTAALAYDANGNLTSQTLYVEGGASPASRQTTYTNDVRGRTIVTVGPTAPYVVDKYDNVGRRVAVGLYSSSSGLGAGTDPTTTSSNRVALSQTLFDEVGRVYKTEVRKIIQATGAEPVPPDILESLTWYDASGRVIKEDGSQLIKIAYDRLGRQTNQFILADDNDTTYSDASGVGGDHVLQEQQTAYRSTTSNVVLMTVVIDRFHDDLGGTGALDSNEDGETPDPLKLSSADVSGRPQITAYWYDPLDRVTDTVVFGMYDTDSNGSFDTFDRSSFIQNGVDSPPGRADDKLRTTYTYNPDGSLLEVRDPRDLKTRYLYDTAGRQTSVIRNYVDATPGGTTGDEDQTVRYEYLKGLQSKLIADLPGTSDDETTEYTYGVTTSGTGPSTVNANNLLRSIKYPDLESGETDPDDRQVLFAYNAQAQQIWTRDQANNQITTEFDPAGRLAHQRATNINTTDGFDDYVKRISTTYDVLGRRKLVTQYDNASTGSGNVRDEVAYSYDDWGNLALFEQDRNSAVGASGSVDDYEVSFTYAKASGGRNTIRRATEVIPSGATVSYDYLSAGGVLDDKASRVSQVKLAASPAIVLAKYFYNGPADVVGMESPEPAIRWHRYGSTSGVYPDLDRFNRVTTSRWTRVVTPSGCTGGGQTNPDFYNVDITYDRNSNIELVEDIVHGGFDVDYVMDNLDRLRKAEEGTWNGSAITSRTRQQLWQDNTGALALDQVGNWDRVRLDLNGDGSFNGSKEYDDSRTHTLANELKTRDTDSNGTANYTLAHDKPGNLTDDGVRYTYVYDVFGRLRKVKNRSGGALVAEYRYNGLGYRIGWHYDVDTDGTVEDPPGSGSDPWMYFAYDERWRIVAMFLGEDDPDAPKERFVYHTAGFDGLGGSSYIDDVIIRDRDFTGGWGSSPPPSDGVLEERRYYCQNWRHDVVAVLTDTARQVEQVRYSSYGIPFCLPNGDTDGDGDADSTDSAQITTWKNAGTYDARGDLDLNGCVNGTDLSLFRSSATLGWGVLSKSDMLNRKGYDGYEFDPVLQPTFSVYHVRNRVLNADLGRWLTRDPIGYVDGANLYVYATSNPSAGSDPFGTGPWDPFTPGPWGRRPHGDPRPPPGSDVPRPTVSPCAPGRRPHGAPRAAPGPSELTESSPAEVGAPSLPSFPAPPVGLYHGCPSESGSPEECRACVLREAEERHRACDESPDPEADPRKIRERGRQRTQDCIDRYVVDPIRELRPPDTKGFADCLRRAGEQLDKELKFVDAWNRACHELADRFRDNTLQACEEYWSPDWPYGEEFWREGRPPWCQ